LTLVRQEACLAGGFGFGGIVEYGKIVRRLRRVEIAAGTESVDDRRLVEREHFFLDQAGVVD
jgi:hypothetical protein